MSRRQFRPMRSNCHPELESHAFPRGLRNSHQHGPLFLPPRHSQGRSSFGRQNFRGASRSLGPLFKVFCAACGNSEVPPAELTREILDRYSRHYAALMADPPMWRVKSGKRASAIIAIVAQGVHPSVFVVENQLGRGLSLSVASWIRADLGALCTQYAGHKA